MIKIKDLQKKYKGFVLLVNESVSNNFKKRISNDRLFKGKSAEKTSDFKQKCEKAIELKNTVQSLNEDKDSNDYLAFEKNYDLYLYELMKKYLEEFSCSEKAFNCVSEYFNGFCDNEKYGKEINEYVKQPSVDFKVNGFEDYLKKRKPSHIREMYPPYSLWKKLSFFKPVKEYDNKEVLYFEDFIAAMQFAKHKEVSFEKYLSGDRESINYYKDKFIDFKNKNARKPIAIRMKKFNDTRDIYFQVYLYGELNTDNNRVCLVNFDNKIIGEPFIKDLLESLIIVDNLYLNVNPVTNVPAQTLSCLKLLIPYFDISLDSIKAFMKEHNVKDFDIPKNSNHIFIKVFIFITIAILSLVFAFFLGMNFSNKESSNSNFKENSKSIIEKSDSEHSQISNFENSPQISSDGELSSNVEPEENAFQISSNDELSSDVEPEENVSQISSNGELPSDVDLKEDFSQISLDDELSSDVEPEENASQVSSYSET